MLSSVQDGGRLVMKYDGTFDSSLVTDLREACCHQHEMGGEDRLWRALLLSPTSDQEVCGGVQCFTIYLHSLALLLRSPFPLSNYFQLFPIMSLCGKNAVEHLYSLNPRRD